MIRIIKIRWERLPQVWVYCIPKIIDSFFLRTGFILVAGGISAQGLGALTGFLIARKIGPANYGQYAIAFALVSSFVFTFLLGLDSVVVREVASSPGDAGKIISSAGLPAAVWSICLVIIICLLGRWLGYSSEVITLISIFAPAIAFRGMINLARAALRGFEKLGSDAIIQFFEAALALAFIAILLSIHSSALSAAWGLFLGEVAAFGLAIFLMSRILGPGAAFRSKLAIRLIKDAAPIGMTFTLLGINLRLEMVVLGMFTSKVEIGKYAAALSIVMLTRSLSLISAALLPRLSTSYSQGLNTFLPMFKKGFWRITILGSAAGLIIYIFGEPMLLFIFSQEFISAAGVLEILAVMSAVMFVNTYLWQAMIATKAQSAMSAGILATLLVTGGLLVYLIPKSGIYGAALASLGREVCQAILLSWFLYRRLL